MNSRSHLIPIKKAVFDRNKGFILRTYYVKPEYIERLIKRSLGLTATPVIQIKDLPKIIDSIRLNNPTLLKDTFDKGKLYDEYKSVINRNLALNRIIEEKPYYYNKQKAQLGILSFVLSLEKDFISKLKTTISQSSIFYDISIKKYQKEFPLIKIYNKNKGNKNSFDYPRKIFMKAENLKGLIKIMEKSYTLNNSRTFEVKRIIIPKAGYVSLYNKIQKVKNYIWTGKYLSKYINYTLPHPEKVLAILNKLITSTKEISPHLLNINLSPLINWSNLDIKDDKLIKIYPYLVLDILYNYYKITNNYLNPKELKELYLYGIDENSIIYKFYYLKYKHPDLYEKLIVEDSKEMDLLSKIDSYFDKYSDFDLYKRKSDNDNFKGVNVINCEYNYMCKLLKLMFEYTPEEVKEYLFSYYIPENYDSYYDVNKSLVIYEALLNRSDVDTRFVYENLLKHEIENLDNFFNHIIMKTVINYLMYLDNYIKTIQSIEKGNSLMLLENNFLSDKYSDYNTLTKELKEYAYINPFYELVLKIIRPSYVNVVDVEKMLGFDTAPVIIPRLLGSKYTKHIIKSKIKENLFNLINKSRSVLNKIDKVYIPIISNSKIDNQIFRYLKPIEVAFIDIDKLPDHWKDNPYIDFIEVDKNKLYSLPIIYPQYINNKSEKGFEKEVEKITPSDNLLLIIFS